MEIWYCSHFESFAGHLTALEDHVREALNALLPHTWLATCY